MSPPEPNNQVLQVCGPLNEIKISPPQPLTAHPSFSVTPTFTGSVTGVCCFSAGAFAGSAGGAFSGAVAGASGAESCAGGAELGSAGGGAA